MLTTLKPSENFDYHGDYQKCSPFTYYFLFWRCRCALAFASEEVKTESEIIFSALAQNGCALQFAPTICKQDKDIVLAAVAQNGYLCFLFKNMPNRELCFEYPNTHTQID